MKLYCPKSGVTYHTSCGYGHGQATHPIFQISTKKLLDQNLEHTWNAKLPPEDVHLLGAALLDKLPVIWDSPLDIENCKKVWAANMEKLAATVLRIDSRVINNLPKFRVTKETRNLSTLSAYLSEISTVLNDSFSAFKESTSTFTMDYNRHTAEESIVRTLRTVLDTAGRKKKLPNLMADWACDVGEFPKTLITIEIGKPKITLAEHWKSIITRIFSYKSLSEILSDTITLGDIEELIEHCECNIELGSLHSLSLFKRLRETKEVIQEFRSPALSEITVPEELTAEFLLGDTPENPVSSKQDSLENILAKLKSRKLK